MIGPENYEDALERDMMRRKGGEREMAGAACRAEKARLITSANGHSSAILKTVGRRLLKCAAATASLPAATITSLQRHKRRE